MPRKRPRGIAGERIQQTIAGILIDLFKKDYKNQLIIPVSDAHERIKQRLIGRGVSGEALSEDYIAKSIRNKKNQKRDLYLVDIFERGGKQFYGNQRNRFYPIFMELPNYVVDKSYLHKTLPTSIASRKETQEEYGAKPEIILENIQNHFMYRDEEWFKEKKWLETKLKEEHIENMIDNWNSCCNKGSQPFGKTKSGKYFVNPGSPYLP